MSVESTIQSLLEDAKRFSELDENRVTRDAVAPEAMKGIEADQGAQDEPSNTKNNVGTQKRAEGDTAKKPNAATRAAIAPETMKGIEADQGAEKEPSNHKNIHTESFDMADDVEALFNGEDGLTEEFRQKAETIFEAAVTSRIKEEVARIEEAYEERFQAALEEAINKNVEGLVEHIDGYLNLMVEQWMEKNEVALVSGMKADILESFVGGLKGLFEEHYIDVPEEKFDVMESLETKVEELETKLNEAIQLNVELNQALSETVRADIVASVCEGLTDIEAEKLQTLAEEIAFEDADGYAEKLQVIRENYFTKKSVKNVQTSTFLTEETIQEEKVIPAEMSAYVSTISMLNR